jgi:uncharacterized protein YunC (DUF1805 family)
MEIITKSFNTPKGQLEGVQVKWPGFSILLAASAKGFLACGVFDLAATERFGVAAALVESTPDNPIGTLERFPNRRIMAVNAKARELGIEPGMDVVAAMERLL